MGQRIAHFIFYFLLRVRIARLDSLQLFLSTAAACCLLLVFCFFPIWYVAVWISNDNPNDLWAVYLGSYDEHNQHNYCILNFL
jgi:hypothetical protein